MMMLVFASFVGNVFYKDLFNSFSSRKTIDLVELSGAALKESFQGAGYLQVKGKDWIEIIDILYLFKKCFKFRK